MKKNVLELYPYFKKSISQEFHQKTKIEQLAKPDKSGGKSWPKEWVEINYKGYPRFPRIKLPIASDVKYTDLIKALKKRNSTREFGKKKMSLSQFSTLLHYSAGIKNRESKDEVNRFYPSAGARFPLEVYPILFNVQGFKNGIYHYHLKSLTLELLRKNSGLKNSILKNFSQSWLSKSAVIFVISAVFWRNEVKYGD